MSLKIINERIYNITFIDLAYKSKDELFASLLEELGELARELKIEYKIFGNTYKKPDEGIKGESVDFFICCIAMTENKCASDNLFFMYDSQCLVNHKKIFSCLKSISDYIHFNSWIHAAQSALDIFFACGGTEIEFYEIANKKLDKWEKSQNDHIESLATQP